MKPTQDEIRFLARCQMQIFYKLWLRWRDSPLPRIRREGLKCKAFGLVHHDRTIDRLGG